MHISLIILAAEMDIFQYVETREIKFEDIFSGDKNRGRVDDLSHLFKKLSSLMDKKIRAWWDIVSFEHYMANDIVPRRLRWDIPPNDGLEDEESLKEWFLFFNSKGKELLSFLLVRKQRKLKIIENQVKEIKDRMDQYKDTAEFAQLANELKKKMEKVDKETQEKKRKKFMRDINDFKSKEVFKWQSNISDNAPASRENSPENITPKYPPPGPKQNTYKPPQHPETQNREYPRAPPPRTPNRGNWRGRRPYRGGTQRGRAGGRGNHSYGNSYGYGGYPPYPHGGDEGRDYTPREEHQRSQGRGQGNYQDQWDYPNITTHNRYSPLSQEPQSFLGKPHWVNNQPEMDGNTYGVREREREEEERAGGNKRRKYQ